MRQMLPAQHKCDLFQLSIKKGDMEAEHEHHAALLQFLLELVQGRWNAVLPPVENATAGIGDTTVQGLTLLLSDELRNLILHNAFVNPRSGYSFVAYGLILLDGDFIVQSVSQGTADFLERSPVSLYKTEFTTLLDHASKAEFYRLAGSTTALSSGEMSELHFKKGDGTSVRAHCFFAPLLYGKNCVAVTIISLRPLALSAPESEKLSPVGSLTAVQQTYDYILCHREGPLPSARVLARRFGTNEFELKRDFKKLFGRSIYQCYTLARLERAYSLIKSSNLTLAEVARQSGFEDYSSFAKAFRKHYKISPTAAKIYNS